LRAPLFPEEAPPSWGNFDEAQECYYGDS